MVVACDSPLKARLRAWAEERFPARNAAFFLVLFAAAASLGRAAAAPGPLPVQPLDAAGFLAVVGFFLTLRVLDEHKDWADDCRDHPGRVLQRGLVTLGHLRGLGAAAVAVQLAASLAYDGGAGRVTAWWIATFAYALLMAREFFAGERLRRHPVAYALSHLPVMALATAWMAQMGAGAAPLASGAGWIAGLGFASGAAFEVARKLRVEGDEQPTVGSYAKALGVRGAAAAVGILAALAAACAALALRAALGAAPAPAIWIFACAPCPAAAASAAFARTPTRARARRAERVLGLALLAVHGGVALSIAAARGLR